MLAMLFTRQTACLAYRKSWLHSPTLCKPDVVVHVCTIAQLSGGEIERSEVQRHPQLHRVFQTSLRYVRPSHLEKKRQKMQSGEVALSRAKRSAAQKLEAWTLKVPTTLWPWKGGLIFSVHLQEIKAFVPSRVFCFVFVFVCCLKQVQTVLDP